MPRILGLDIADDSVRGAVVRLALRRIEVERYAEAPITPADDPEGKAEALAEAMRQLMTDLDRTVDGAVVALSGEEASLRRIDVPAAAVKRLKQVLPFELESLLPFELDEALIDYQPISKGFGQVAVLATAVPKTRIVQRLAELSPSSVEVMEMAVGAAALDGLVHVVPALGSGGPHFLVHVDRRSTDIAILENGRCVLARTVSSGLDDLERGLRAELDSGMRRTLAGYRSQGGSEPVSFFLSGLGPEVPACVAELEAILGLPVTTLTLPTPPIVPPEWAPRFARALALAARMAGKEKRINLRQGEFAPTRTIGGIRKHVRLLGIGAAAVLAAFLFSVTARHSVLSAEHDVLVERLASTSKELLGEEVRTAAEARALLNRQRTAPDPLPRFDAFDALDAVSRSIPAEITHTTRRLLIEIDDESHDGRFEIEGQVGSIAERDTIAGKLEEQGCFQESERGPTRPGPGNEGTMYRLEAKLICTGDGAAPAAGQGSPRRSRESD
jgi:Tfp pilus assembly PilM family ATPase